MAKKTIKTQEEEVVNTMDYWKQTVPRCVVASWALLESANSPMFNSMSMSRERVVQSMVDEVFLDDKEITREVFEIRKNIISFLNKLKKSYNRKDEIKHYHILLEEKG